MDLESVKNIIPVAHRLPELDPDGEFAGITALTFDAMPRHGKKTMSFAYIGFPAGASPEQPVPGIVLVHGGRGHAYRHWIRLWNSRGYAAIALDNTGYFPRFRNADDDFEWSHGVPPRYNDGSYTDTPDNDNMASSSGAPEDMWMYHAVCQTILAHSLLRADPRVNGRIGITGISWGGVISSLVIGYDDRFAFAVPVYGSGYLDAAYSEFGRTFSGDATRRLWSAATRFDRVNMPVLWQCWNEDRIFSVNSNSLSYLATVRNNPHTRLCIRNGMGHSHSEGWAPPEAMLFADSAVRGTPELTGFAVQPSGRVIDAVLTASGDISARLCYIDKSMSYTFSYENGVLVSTLDQRWRFAPLSVSGSRVTGEVPPDAAAYYIELTTRAGGVEYVTSSVFVEFI